MAILVVSEAGRVVAKVTREEAARMVRRGQVSVVRDGRVVRLRTVGEPWKCRTRVAREGILAAVGRSQQYTMAGKRGAVDGFKTIYPEDKVYFSPGNDE